METVSNVASTVTTTVKQAIWGDQTAQGNEKSGEPISGQQGKGTVNEPFDQGNAENPATTSTTEPTTSANPTPNSKLPETMSSIPPNTESVAAGGAPNPLQETDKTGVTGSMGESTKASDVVPSESSHPGVPPSSGGLTEQKQQGADRPAETPSTTVEKKEEAEDFMKTRDPNDHSGEPMKMHDGSESKKIPETQEERRESAIGLPGGQEHGKPAKGTGEDWVKTSGLHADGGDFDVTKPGAGREADRLLEEKGIKKEGGNTGPPADLGSPSSGDKEGKEKVKLSEKIKTKLHIGHKDK
ncbi:hypothetical protein EJ04DRAFT_572492 [Polyplosphaeria fusca]|uniref:Glycine-rich cell wall structural protein 1 n=1 Tax=Polyplosphaeria fusca TaxID=682080 RepID=A0A9P4RB24_9PLEO|nr:hypothetical protein EJ04DRAFT_572492 [Polyplosphaeria fusca]